MKEKDEYLNEIETAELTRLSRSKIQNDRWLRKGIPFLKIGRRIIYRRSDVIAYLESHRIKF